MFNKRHKVILFITLVLTGSGLLAGMTLREAIGMFILGASFAWIVGSGTTLRTYNYLRTVPNMTWPWLRILLLMMIGGCLLVAVAVLSNLNSFIVAAVMCIWGILIASLCGVPTQRRWARFVIWVLGVVVFFAAIMSTTMLSAFSEEHAERVGQLAFWGLIALGIGMAWLVKGWRLVLAGIRATRGSTATEAEDAGTTKPAKWLYVSLFGGTISVSLWLAAAAFLAFSNSVLAMELKPSPNPSTQPNPLYPVIFPMLLAWWPYASWKSILQREPNTAPAHLKTHKRVTLALGMLFVAMLCVAAMFGIQNGNDRVAAGQVQEGMKDFQDVAIKIGNIKSRDLRTTKDYIDAYNEIDPLLAEFDRRLKRFTEIILEARQTERNRGPFNVQTLFAPNEKEWLEWDEQMYGLLRQDSDLTRKQVLVVQQMAALPAQLRVGYWQTNFQPLAEEEGRLRQKILALEGSAPGKTSK